jgi:hypothetical protein
MTRVTSITLICPVLHVECTCTLTPVRLMLMTDIYMWWHFDDYLTQLSKSQVLRKFVKRPVSVPQVLQWWCLLCLRLCHDCKVTGVASTNVLRVPLFEEQWPMETLADTTPAFPVVKKTVPALFIGFFKNWFFNIKIMQCGLKYCRYRHVLDILVYDWWRGRNINFVTQKSEVCGKCCTTSFWWPPITCVGTAMTLLNVDMCNSKAVTCETPIMWYTEGHIPIPVHA